MRADGIRKLLATMILCWPLVGCAGSTPPASAPSPLLGKALPSFNRPAIGGESVAPRPGNLVVVKFFAKYCEPCKHTLPAAQELHTSNPDVLIIGIAEDEHSSDVQEVVQRYGLTFPVVHDRGNVLAGRFRVRELPVTFVADREGNVRWVGGPDQNERDLERAIDSLE